MNGSGRTEGAGHEARPDERVDVEAHDLALHLTPVPLQLEICHAHAPRPVSGEVPHTASQASRRALYLYRCFVCMGVPTKSADVVVSPPMTKSRRPTRVHVWSHRPWNDPLAFTCDHDILSAHTRQGADSRTVV